MVTAKIKNHWIALVLAVFLSFLMVLPFFYFQAALGGQYKGILNEVIDDGLFYMARIKDVMDGHPTLGNAYLSEHKNQLPQQLFLPEFFLAKPLEFLNFDIVQGRMLYSFIFPAIIFILTYLAFYLIYPSRFWANLFSVFLIFGFYLFKFTRPIIPQFVFLFWLSQFIFLWQLVKIKYDDIMIYNRISQKWVLLLSILNFGLLFYIYPFYWTFYLVFFIFLIAVFFFKDRLLSKQFLKTLFGGLAIGSFYFYFTFLASRLVEYQETLTRLQLVFSRSPSEIKSVALSLAVLFLIGVLYHLKVLKINREALFFVAGLVSIILVTNQNIITGQKFEFGHYRMLTIFFSVFALYYLLSLPLTIHVNNKWQKVILLVVSLFIFQGVGGYVSRTLKISEQDVYSQKYAAVFEWFNENTPKDSVVYANEEISRLIPVYTANNVFYSRFANLFIISDREAEERFILNNFFEKIDRDFVIERERSIWGVRYVDRYGDAVQANKWRKILNLKLKDQTRLPESEIERILAAVGKTKKAPLKESLIKYRVDYFIWDKNKDPNWEPAKLNLKPVYNFENTYVFEI